MTDEVKISYEKALDLFSGGHFEEAANALLELIKLHPSYADAYEALGRVYYKLNRLDDAIEWIQKLADLRPDYALAHTNLSVFYMKKGMKEKAEEEKAKATVLSFQNFSKPKPYEK